MKSDYYVRKALLSGRTPHGVRGLKLMRSLTMIACPWSHPARGAWIEIPMFPMRLCVLWRRTPHGVRGLKLLGSVARI